MYRKVYRYKQKRRHRVFWLYFIAIFFSYYSNAVFVFSSSPLFLCLFQQYLMVMYIYSQMLGPKKQKCIKYPKEKQDLQKRTHRMNATTTSQRVNRLFSNIHRLRIIFIAHFCSFSYFYASVEPISIASIYTLISSSFFILFFLNVQCPVAVLQVFLLLTPFCRHSIQFRFDSCEHNDAGNDVNDDGDVDVDNDPLCAFKNLMHHNSLVLCIV